jgi:hypothetical protein
MNGNLRLRITGIEAIPISIPSRGFNSALRIWPLEGPGLGVTLDDDELDRYRQS